MTAAYPDLGPATARAQVSPHPIPVEAAPGAPGAGSPPGLGHTEELQEAPVSSSGWAEALAVGAVAPGVNAPTWATVNLCLVLVIALAALAVLPLALVLAPLPSPQPLGSASPLNILNSAFSSSAVDFALATHVLVLVAIALALLGTLNWFISSVGTVSVESQKKDLGLYDSPDGTSDLSKKQD